MAKIHIIYFDVDTGYYPGFHHGIASLSACIKRSGHILTFQHIFKKESPEAVANRALINNPDIIGFSVTTNQRKYLVEYSGVIRNRSSIIQIAGGVHPTIAPIDVLNIDSINGICIGEAEYILVDLLNRIDRKEDIYNVPGFWWKDKEGNIIKNEIPGLEEDVSMLPFPDYSIFNAKSIIESSSGWVSMMVSRGCPYDCYYCCNHVLASVYPSKKNYLRLPDAEYAVSLIKNNLNYFEKFSKIRGIIFADDLLTYRKNWFIEFINKFDREIKLPFILNARVEHLTEDIIIALKNSGCEMVQLGIESGNEQIREKLLNRSISNNQIIDTFNLLHKHRLRTFSYNIVGFPFETKKQMKETLNLNKIIKPDAGNVFFFYPYPGTKLYSICKENNLLLENSENFSGYFEGFAIKLTNCNIIDVFLIYNKLKLYLSSRIFVKNFGMFGEIISNIIYFMLSLYPSFFVKLITRNSLIKYKIRKIIYKFIS